MLSKSDIEGIIQLRLLVARAAQKDSLHWWEDESLTQAGSFLVERLFVTDAPETSRKLAIEAARTRYRMAIGEERKKLHLFWLDKIGQTEYDLLGVRYLNYDMPSEPIGSIDMLREKLLALTGDVIPYERIGGKGNEQMEIRVKGFPGKVSPLGLAKTFAWACLESTPGKPVFPYIQLST